MDEVSSFGGLVEILSLTQKLTSLVPLLYYALSLSLSSFSYMSYSEFCIRVCISENTTYSAALECQHTLDEMGCEW